MRKPNLTLASSRSLRLGPSGSDAATDEEHVSLTHNRSVALYFGESLLLLGEVESGKTLIDYDAGIEVFVRVDDEVELWNGALLSVAGRWFCYWDSQPNQPARLQMLGEDGRPVVVVTLRNGSLGVGGERGDLMLPGEPEVEVLHFMLLRCGGRTFLRNLANDQRPWVIVPRGTRVSVESTLAVGDRLLYLDAPGSVSPSVLSPAPVAV